MNPVLDTSLHERRRARADARSGVPRRLRASGGRDRADRSHHPHARRDASRDGHLKGRARAADRPQRLEHPAGSSPRTRPSQSSRSSPRSPRRSGFAWPSSPRRRRRRGSCASTTPEASSSSRAGGSGSRRTLTRVTKGRARKSKQASESDAAREVGPDAALEHNLLPSRRRDGPGLGLPRLLPGQTPRGVRGRARCRRGRATAAVLRGREVGGHARRHDRLLRDPADRSEP